MSFSFEDRAKAKAAARARDEERLAAREISAADLQRENNQFRSLSKKIKRVHYVRAGKFPPGERGPYFGMAAERRNRSDDDGSKS